MGGIVSAGLPRELANEDIRLKSTNPEDVAKYVRKLEIAELRNVANVDDPEPGEPCVLYISGLSMDWNERAVARMLRRAGVVFAKVHKKSGKTFGAVSFDSNRDRRKAFQRMQMVRCGRRGLNVRPMTGSIEEARNDRKMRRIGRNEMNLTVERVLPWIRVDYEEQIRQKSLRCWRALNMIRGTKLSVIDVVKVPDLTAPVDDIELTIGVDEMREVVIGFNVGSRTEPGFVSFREFPRMPRAVTPIGEALTRIILGSSVDVFDPETMRGFWKSLRVRTTKDETMVMVIIGGYGKLPEHLVAELHNEFNEVTSLYWAETYSVGSTTFHHIGGVKSIIDSSTGVAFTVLPDSKFPSGEMGKRVVESILSLDGIDKSVIVDTDFASGFFSTVLAQSVHHVIAVNAGREMVISNVECISDPIEDAICEVSKRLKRLRSSSVFLLHPPHFGVHRSHIEALRDAKCVDCIVAFSDNPELLARMISDVFVDDHASHVPFHVESAQAFDFSPGTDSVSLLFVLRRVPS